MSWQGRLCALHRDLGYLSLGLTIVFGISGLAMNHRHQWNYNRSTQVEERRLGAPSELLAGLSAERREAIARDLGTLSRDEEPKLVEAIGRALAREAPPRSYSWRGADRLNLYYSANDTDTVEYTPSTGTVRLVKVRDRPLLRDLNFLHRNEPGGVWTWFADAFALCLIFLGVSGALIVRGRHGLRGRGGILVAVGLLLPIAVVVIKRYL